MIFPGSLLNKQCSWIFFLNLSMQRHQSTMSLLSIQAYYLIHILLTFYHKCFEVDICIRMWICVIYYTIIFNK